MWKTILHTAARVHVMHGASEDSWAALRTVNVDGTLRLATQAASAGVRRLVFVSSVKVNGEATSAGSLFSPFDPPRPEGDYGRSKWEAERTLWEVSEATGLEVVVVRPPLVYGPGVKANFARLLRLVRFAACRRLPLPLGAIHNRRSLVALDNLVDLLIQCTRDPSAVGQTFLVSDGEDLSTTELVRAISTAMGLRVWLLPVPARALVWGGRLAGRLPEVERMIRSLQVDIAHTCVTLKWRPPIGVREGLAKAVAPF